MANKRRRYKVKRRRAAGKLLHVSRCLDGMFLKECARLNYTPTKTMLSYLKAHKLLRTAGSFITHLQDCL